MNENEYGWLLIDTPEKKQKYRPSKVGDEFKVKGGWVALNQHNLNMDFCAATNCCVFRRPLVPPSDPDWELVGLDEVPPERCETFNFADVWEATTFFRETRTIREIIAAECPGIRAIRRKRQPQPATGWISVKERLPEPYPNDEAVPVEVYDQRDNRKCVFFSNASGYIKQYTHWKYITFSEPPPLPVVEVDEAEKVFKAFLGQYDGHDKGLLALYPVKEAIAFALQQKATK